MSGWWYREEKEEKLESPDPDCDCDQTNPRQTVRFTGSEVSVAATSRKNEQERQLERHASCKETQRLLLSVRRVTNGASALTRSRRAGSKTRCRSQIQESRAMLGHEVLYLYAG